MSATANQALMRRLLLGLSLLLGSCASLPPDSHCARLARGVTYCTQPLPSGVALSLHQLVEYRMPNLPDAEALVFAVEAADQTMHVVALTPMGQTVFRLELTGGKLQWDGPPQVAPLADILPAMIQLALWPEATVAAGLRGGELEADTLRRRVHAGDTPVLETRQSVSDPTRGEIEVRFMTIEARFLIRNLTE